MNIHWHYQQDQSGWVVGAHRKWAGRLGWWCHWRGAQQRGASVWRAPPSGWCRCPGRRRPSGLPVAAWIAAVGNMVICHLYSKKYSFEIYHRMTLYGIAKVRNIPKNKSGKIYDFGDRMSELLKPFPMEKNLLKSDPTLDVRSLLYVFKCWHWWCIRGTESLC